MTSQASGGQRPTKVVIVDDANDLSGTEPAGCGRRRQTVDSVFIDLSEEQDVSSSPPPRSKDGDSCPASDTVDHLSLSKVC